MNQKICVVIPNWNGKQELAACLGSLLKQTVNHEIVVVENGSIDDSAAFLAEHYPEVTVLPQKKNLGFAGGVNVGIRYALQSDFTYVGLLNNDAVVEKNWIGELAKALDNNPGLGIVTSKVISGDGTYLDSTEEAYTSWGLPYSRGRKETDLDAYDNTGTTIFGASGGASMYRATMFQQIGLFDEDFFAYYEDIDLSFRAQLAGWKIAFAPNARAYHKIGATSSKIKGFTTYQTIKNYPWLLVKNVPFRLMPTILPRFILAHTLFVSRAFLRGHGWYAVKGLFRCTLLLPKKILERRRIQKHKQVTDEYIGSILTWDLPPNATNLRNLRAKWWKLRRKT